MKHIKKFESYENYDNDKVNEEFDFGFINQLIDGISKPETMEFIQQFLAWLKTERMFGIEFYKNWQLLSAAIGSIGLLGTAVLATYRQFSKTEKEKINRSIANEIMNNPDADPKEIADKVTQEHSREK